MTDVGVAVPARSGERGLDPPIEDAATTRVPTRRRPEIAFAGLMAVHPGRWQYRLPDLWSLLLVDYRSRARLGGRPYALRPGTVMLMEPDVPKDYHHLEHSTHHVVHFRADLPRGEAVRVPPAFDPGVLAAAVRDRIQVVVSAFPSDRDRAEVALWDLLHVLAEVPVRSGRPDVVEEVTRAIDSQLHRRLDVAALVARSGYSHGHLLELFRARHGDSIVGYIRRRRMEQAGQLLTTDMPIATIAAQIGLPDLHAFNKAVRQAHGCGPRELRRRLTDGD